MECGVIQIGNHGITKQREEHAIIGKKIQTHRRGDGNRGLLLPDLLFMQFSRLVIVSGACMSLNPNE